MSLNAGTSHAGGSFGQLRALPFKLENAGHFLEWKRHLQAAAFAMFRNADLSTLKVEQTIDLVYYSEKDVLFSVMFQSLPVMSQAPVKSPPVGTPVTPGALPWSAPIGPRPTGEPVKPVWKSKAKAGGLAHKAATEAFDSAMEAFEVEQEKWYV